MSVQGFLSNLVSETTETQGTGDYVLEGPAAGRRAFRERFADGGRPCYVAQQIQRDGNDNIIAIYFETGIGVLTYGVSDTITRASIIDSSNGGSAVNWGAGEKTIWCAAPGELMVMLEAALAAAQGGRPVIVNPTSDGFTLGNPLLGVAAASELTIAAGSITPTQAFHTVDTEADAASDALTAIATTNIADGGLLLLTVANAARDVVVTHAGAPTAGQIYLLTGANYTLDDAEKFILLQRRGDYWVEMDRGRKLGADIVDDGTGNLTTKLVGNTFSVDTSVVAADRNRMLLSGAADKTLTLLAPATAGAGWAAQIYDLFGGTILSTPSGVLDVNGVNVGATYTMSIGEAGFMLSNGARYRIWTNKPVATTALRGVVQVGDGLSVSDGVVSGLVLQRLAAAPYTANTALSTNIPIDDSTPISTEGTQILSQAITPKSATSKINIKSTGTLVVSTGAGIVCAALFRGTTCIKSQPLYCAGANSPVPWNIDVYDEPGSTSEQTYSIRVGANSVSVFCNGTSSGRLFGGVANCTLGLVEFGS